MAKRIAGQWTPVSPKAPSADREVMLPRIFHPRCDFWLPLLSSVDDTASDPAVWDFLASMIAALQPRVIVEAGTYRGHGAFAMGEALLRDKIEGHIHTADVEDHYVYDALDRAGLGQYVTFYHGRFEHMLELVQGPIDLAFIDASEEENAALRIDYLNLVLPRLSPHGIAIVDDATDDGWPGAKVLRDQCSLYLPTGRGLALFQAKA